MDKRMTAERLQSVRVDLAGHGARGGLGRARRRLAILLPMYVAVTAYAVLAGLVALPLLVYLGDPDSDVVGLARDFLSPLAVPVAVTLALGMRILLQNMLRSGAADAAHERGTVHELTVGLAVLCTLFLALLLMRPINWASLGRGILLAVVAYGGLFGWTLILAGPARDGGELTFLIGISGIAVAMIAAVLVPALQLFLRLRDGRAVATSLGFAAIVMAVAAALVSAAIILLFSAPDSTDSLAFAWALFLVILILIFALPSLAFLLLPVLLRASTGYAWRRSLKPAPTMFLPRNALKIVLPVHTAVTAAVALATFVAFPLAIYLALYFATDDPFSGIEAAVFAFFSAPLVPGAVVLLLKMRSVLNHLQDADARSKQPRNALTPSGLPPHRWAIVAVGTILAAFAVNLLLLFLSSIFAPLIYPVTYAVAALALTTLLGTALWRILSQQQGKQILRYVLIAAASGVAGMAPVAALTVMSILGLYYFEGGISGIYSTWVITVMLMLLGFFLLLPPLLRASAAHARLRRAGSTHTIRNDD